jgi:glucokinase
MAASQAIGLDLGGTDLKYALVGRDGSLAAFDRRPSRTAESAAAPLAALVAAVGDLGRRAEGEVVGIGLGCPGVILPGEGRLLDRTAHLPHWSDRPVARELAGRTGQAVVADNDANLAALAEHRLGAARGTRVSLTVTLGTGIGCGIVIEGRLFRGAWGGAGELGHVPLGRGGGGCACGVRDCVEPEASGSALEEAARRLGLGGAGELFERAAAGGGPAAEALARFADRLGATLGTAVQILNPEAVVIGGGLARAGETLLSALRPALERYVLGSHRAGLEVRLAALGERAGVVGAGLLAWDELAGPERAPVSGS